MVLGKSFHFFLVRIPKAWMETLLTIEWNKYVLEIFVKENILFLVLAQNHRKIMVRKISCCKGHFLRLSWDNAECWLKSNQILATFNSQQCIAETILNQSLIVRFKCLKVFSFVDLANSLCVIYTITFCSCGCELCNQICYQQVFKIENAKSK